MKRVIALIDGLNVYYSLERSENNKYQKYKWLNLKKLLLNFINPGEELKAVHYFTALPLNPNKRKRHLTYLKALQNEGIKYEAGKIVQDPEYCPLCKRPYQKTKEKQTDAKIIVSALGMSIHDDFDIALVVSGDSDLVPMITGAKSLPMMRNGKFQMSDKKFRLIIPIGQRAVDLINVCDEYKKIDEIHLKNSQFEKNIVLGNGENISKPLEWQIDA
jgi:uncharacterized LabA/DUF88 family protein